MSGVDPGATAEALVGRPTRAELRRAAEAEAAAAARATASRAERRRLEDEQSKQQQARTSVWRAWWLYPLVALIGLCVYLGIESSADAPPAKQPVVQITDAP
jgi:hypothetical protein